MDAGLYAELVKNRSFEYGTEAANGAYHGWINSNADVLEFTVTDGSADHTGLNATIQAMQLSPIPPRTLRESATSVIWMVWL